MIQSFPKKIVTCLAIGSILIPITNSGSTSVISAEKAVVSLSNTYYSEVIAPILKPVWSAQLAILKKTESPDRTLQHSRKTGRSLRCSAMKN